MSRLSLSKSVVLTGTLLGAEGEREQLTLSCSVQLTNQNVRDDQFSDSEYCDYFHHSMVTNVDDGDNGFVSDIREAVSVP